MICLLGITFASVTLSVCLSVHFFFTHWDIIKCPVLFSSFAVSTVVKK